MDTVSAEHFLNDQIAARYRVLVPTTLKTAYASAAMVIKNEPILQVESALDNRGRITQWAVDLAFKRLIETGQWPFDYRWQNFAKPTGRYLEVMLSHSRMTISQVACPQKQPRDVVFRGNARLNNEPFFEFEEFADERSVQGLPHLLLIHGHQQLNFAHIGVPHKIHQRGYIYRTPNLMMLAHEVPAELPPVEDTDVDATLSLKEEIERWRRDHNE